MGAVTRKLDIRRRRERRQKRKKKQKKALLRALERGRTHPDRVKIAQDFYEKARSA